MADQRKPYANPKVEASVSSVEAALARGFRDLERELLILLGEMDTDDGMLQSTAQNMRRIRSIMSRLKDMVVERALSPALALQAERMGGLAEAVLEEGGEDPRAGGRFDVTTGQALDLLLDGAGADLASMAPQVARELQQLLYRSALGSTSWADLTSAIRDKLDISERQVGSLVGSMIAAFHTSARTAYFGGTADGEPIVEWWLYDGPDDERTRDFCGHLVGTRVTLEQLDSMADAYGRTSPLPPSQSLGGPNCRHELVPLPGDSWKKYPKGPR